MARAYRCAAQPATRVWLDCYYGAAQPVRSALGMAPAPAAQVQLSQTQPAPGLPADVGLRDAAMAEAARCAGVAEDRRWLDCFYAATNPVRAAVGLAPLGGAAVARALPPPPPEQQPVPPPRPQRVSSFLPGIFGATVIEARGHMVNYSYDGNRNFTVTLDNGQVWRQLDGDSSFSHWRRPAGSYLVTITNGAFGSHNLTVKDEPGVFKVKRLS